jgi:hypothetical protein
VRGRATTIRLPDGQSVKAHYEVGELGDSYASHNAQTFQENPNYELRNQRDYTNPLNQEKLITYSSADPQTGFDERELINNSPNATTGPWIEDEQGNVLSGNGHPPNS